MFNKVKPSSSHYSSAPPMSASGIQGQLLEVTVVGCNKLKDTEWISRQDPYVCLEYASSKFRTRTCTDGGKNPTFQEKFVFTLIEGLREFSIVVWNSNTVTYDDLIGTGKIHLQKVLSEGYDDTAWPLQDKRGRHAGEVRLIMHYANAKKPAKTSAPSYPSAPAVPPYSGPPPVASYPPASYPPASYPPASHYPSYPPNSAAYPPNSVAYPPNPAAGYPPTSTGYPPISAGYPPSQYPPPAAAAAYPPIYPPTSSYPPHSTYPPPPDSHYYPPGSYPPSPYPPPSY